MENAGRVNFGRPLGIRKGISGSVQVDGVAQNNWKIYSFEFKNSFVQKYVCAVRGGVYIRECVYIRTVCLEVYIPCVCCVECSVSLLS